MIHQADIESLIRAWQTAARELSIEVHAPFVLRVEGRAHQCIAWVPHFSGRRGILVLATETSRRRTGKLFVEDARTQGYPFSSLEVHSYKEYDRDRYIDMLNEWGYYGPPEKCPAWCVEGNYSATYVP
jgi:hypothetical protein